MATQPERSARARARWIEAGRALFASLGYDGTSTSALLGAAGASKGALYHHFASKQALFEAVFQRVSEDAITRAMAALAPPRAGERATDRLIAGSLAWLDEVRDPAIGRILLEDGPRVLGFERARDLEALTSLALVTRSLEVAVRKGEVAVPDTELMARLLNAVLAEAALIERRAGTDGRARVEGALRALVEGLGR